MTDYSTTAKHTHCWCGTCQRARIPRLERVVMHSKMVFYSDIKSRDVYYEWSGLVFRFGTVKEFEEWCKTVRF